MEKKESINNKILYRTKNQYTVQYLQMLCIQYNSLFTYFKYELQPDLYTALT